MIQDATGKFSSRWVLPDRNSLARFIRTWLLSLYQAWSVSSAAAQSPRVVCAGRKRTPHIGECARKTNLSVMSARPLLGLPTFDRHVATASKDRSDAYCPWFFST